MLQRISLLSWQSSSSTSAASRIGRSTWQESHTEYVILSVVHFSPLNNLPSQGRYIPVFASAVYDQNARLVATGMAPINLKSAMIGRCLRQTKLVASHRKLSGNGCTDWKTMFPSYYEMQCQSKTVDPVVDIR